MTCDTSKQSASAELVTLTIDGKQVSVPKGTTLYQAAEKIGIDIPIFCYHDRMPPLGACRMCLVEVEQMPKLATSCTQTTAEGMVVHTKSSAAAKGRESIVEFLLANHPLDCPICDRGGECPLQENTLTSGPGVSRFTEEKRHFEKRVPLGPALMLDRERCIACARCTRFGELIAGDYALRLIERGYKTEIGTPEGRPVDSKFIGNTIKICPVGALTSQVYRFRARPWDNKPTSSVCTLCSIHCNLTLDSRDGEILRVRSKENIPLNDIWLCDKGWFGYEFVTSKERLTRPLIRKNGNLEEASWDEALNLVALQLRKAKESGQAGAIGGSPLTIEENYLFQKLLREGTGSPHVDYRCGQPTQSLDEEGFPAGTQIRLGETESLDFVILLGADIPESFPLLWLRLKQGINNGTKIYYAGHHGTEMDPFLAGKSIHAPGKEEETLKQLDKLFGAEMKPDAKGAIFVGEQYLHSSQRNAFLATLSKWNEQHQNITLNLLEGTGNDAGARMAGMHPELAPLGSKAGPTGFSSLQMLREAAQSGWSLLYIAGADPASRFPARLWNRAREKTNFLVAQDLFLTETAKQADVVLPALSFAEKGGKVLNIEGQIQNIRPGKEVPESLLSDAEIFTLLGQQLQIEMTLSEELQSALKNSVWKPAVAAPIKEIPVGGAPDKSESGLKLSFKRILFDKGTRVSRTTALSKMVKEPMIELNVETGKDLGLASGDKVKLKSNEGAIEGNVTLCKRIAQNTVVVPLGFPELAAHELSENLLNGLEVKVEKI